MPGLTPEQEAKLDDIDAGEGKNLTPAQKAVMLKFGTIEIKADKPKDGMSVDIPAGPKVVPKTRDVIKPIGQE
tara:strand:- start:1184 stop:1402 length:219 start_codon:yes stop_codon:yes gene_type:complete